MRAARSLKFSALSAHNAHTRVTLSGSTETIHKYPPHVTLPDTVRQDRSMSVRSALAEIAPLVLDRSGLVRAGFPERAIPDAVRTGALRRLRPGWYIDAAFWNRANDRDRHLAAILAANPPRAHTRTDSAGGDPGRLLSHLSAATLHGLPVWSRWIRAGSLTPDPTTLHEVVPPGAANGGSPSTRRHRLPLGDAEVVRIEGFRCTALHRTVFDLARTEPFAVALACADEVLRRTARVRYRVDHEAWDAWRRALLERAARLPRGRGVRAVRALAALAHPLADSPLESVSRLRLLQLGIDVELQYPVPAEDGGTLRLDFRFVGLELFGECDGRAKYVDEELRQGRTADDISYAEKLRYDWVCGTTDMRGVRWGAAQAASADRLAARLRAFRVAVPGTATLSYGSEVADFLNRLPR